MQEWKSKAKDFYAKYCESKTHAHMTEESIYELSAHLSYRASITRALYDENGEPCGFNGKNKQSIIARSAGEAVLQGALKELVTMTFDTQSDFDEWAFEKWDFIREIYYNNGITWYTYGNAQKWFNMAIKYCFVIEYCLKNEIMPNYEYCHFPIDGIMIKENKIKIGVDFDGTSWAKCDDKELLKQYIRSVRRAVKDQCLVEYELNTWS